MSCSEATRKTSDAMRESMMYRTFARIFESGFGAPLYFKAGAKEDGARHPACEASFCLGVNPTGNCCNCPLNKLPRPEKLVPWTWILPCAAGLRVTMVPVPNGAGDTVGWLVSGHVLVDGDGQCSPQANNPRFKDILRMTADRHDLLVNYLETCAGILSANANSLLINLNGHQEWDDAEEPLKADAGSISNTLDGITRLTGLEPVRYVTLCDLERARKRFLRGNGKVSEIFKAAKTAGWLCPKDFLNAFHSCFGEYPDQHLKKTVRLWSDFARTVARI